MSTTRDHPKHCYTCDGTGKADRGWAGDPSPDDVTCPDWQRRRRRQDPMGHGQRPLPALRGGLEATTRRGLPRSHGIGADMDEIWEIMSALRDMNAAANKHGRHLTWNVVDEPGVGQVLTIGVTLTDEDAENVRRMQQFFGAAE